MFGRIVERSIDPLQGRFSGVVRFLPKRSRRHLLAVHYGELKLNVRILRHQPDCFLDFGDGFLMEAEVVVGDAETKVRHFVVMIAPDGGAVFGDMLVDHGELE